MTTCISAVQHLRRLRGGAQSHLLWASDGAFYVTKFQNVKVVGYSVANTWALIRNTGFMNVPVDTGRPTT